MAKVTREQVVRALSRTACSYHLQTQAVRAHIRALVTDGAATIQDGQVLLNPEATR